MLCPPSVCLLSSLRTTHSCCTLIWSFSNQWLHCLALSSSCLVFWPCAGPLLYTWSTTDHIKISKVTIFFLAFRPTPSHPWCGIHVPPSPWQLLLMPFGVHVKNCCQITCKKPWSLMMSFHQLLQSRQIQVCPRCRLQVVRNKSSDMQVDPTLSLQFGQLSLMVIRQCL